MSASLLPTSRRAVPSPSSFPWVSSVAVLLNHGGPSAVAGLVMAVAVDAVQRHAGRPFPHVSEEILEFQPPLADRDPTSAVMGVRGVPGIEAAGHHPIPRSVRSRLFPAERSSLRRPWVPALHLLRNLGGDDAPCLLRVTLALHRVRRFGVMARDVQARSSRVDCAGGVPAAAASAQFRLAFSISHVHSVFGFAATGIFAA